jgi:F-type H+-transporting ATPase subunit b
LNFFAGSSPATKSATFLATVSAATFLLTKEIYLIDAECFEMLAIFAAYTVWYKGGKDAAVSYLTDRKETVKKILQNARDNHRQAVESRLAHLEKLSDIVGNTRLLYQMSQEMAKMEAQVFGLKQRVALKQEVKSTLDSWVRFEANVREQEQKQLVQHVIQKVKDKLLDPKNQNLILQQSLADIEKLK